jgi:catecholate siderophore receptor
MKRRNRAKKFQQRENHSKKQSSKSWVLIGTMGALVTYTAVASRPDALLYAEEVRSNLPSKYASKNISGAMSVFTFNIPGGTLGSVLTAFRKITGIEIIVSDESIFKLPSAGVNGIYTAEQAIEILLQGTDVSYRFVSSNSITLDLVGPSASMEVSGTSPIVSSPKYTEPLRNVPQSITVISKNVMQEQGATTLRDVLSNVPGLTITAGEGGTPAGDNLTLRGFSARNDVFVDGVRDLSPQSRDPFNLEQVEVVKGPDSVYSGRGSAGGVINLVSKIPDLQPAYEGIVSFGNADSRRITADITQPLSEVGLETGAFRLNLLEQDSDFPGRNVVNNQRWGVAPSFALGLGTSTRWIASYFHLEQDNISDYGIPWVPVTNNVLVEFRDRPAPVPRDTFYGFLSRDSEELSSDLFTLRFEHNVNEAIQIRNQIRYGQSDRDSIATPPRFASNDSTIINREMRAWRTDDQIWDNQFDLQAGFNFAGFQHTIVSGLSLTNEQNERRTRVAPNSPTTLLNPNPNDIYTGEIVDSPIVGDVTGKSLAAYAFDTININEHFDLNAGLRWDYFDVDGVTTLGAPVARIDRMTSWRTGAVYKPSVNGSVYVAYGNSFNPSLEGLSYGTANTAIEPEKTYTIEAGSKWDLLNSRISLNGALFRVEKTNARTPGLSPDEPPQVLEGRQQIKGIEFGLTGTINRDWRIFGAYTYLDSEILESNNPLEIGRELQNTPRNSGSIWTTYEFKKLETGAGIRYVSKRFGNNINTRIVDAYWLFDLMASYPLNGFMSLRLNINNLTDEYYFDRLGGGHIVPGPARSISFCVAIHR